MTVRTVHAVLTLVVLVAACAPGLRTDQAKAGIAANKVINQPGAYVSPDGACKARVTISSMGGAFILIAGRSAQVRMRAEDITGMAWVGGHTLVYTTSPIYGVPGVFVYKCDASKSKRIVAPQSISKAYPDGDDYFELEGVSMTEPITAFFYYAPQVDKVDFGNFRTPAFLYQVHLDGSDFRRAESPPK